MDKKLLTHLKKVYGFLEEITLETRDFPAWTIRKRRPHQSAETHPSIKFEIAVNLHPWSDIIAVREAAWDIEIGLRQKLQDGRFHSADDVRKVYEVSEGGLALPEYDLLEKKQRDLLKVSKTEYDSLREIHSGVATAFLKKILNAGKLDDAYIVEGDMGGPEEKSFFDPKGFYLRPPIFLNFLSGKNEGGGPEDFGLRYSIELKENEPAFHEFNLKYNSENRVLTIEDWGLWKLDDRCIKYLDPQPSIEQKIREDSPLVKLLEAYRR
jgi:hypothetical protein